ncbi:hypothetical protein CRE_15975 [Caenorhabditis remanei]|uniref:RING-type domain-containing protein n=1 Tax=Caenorhabditis remanei TaxID=31234 RepID=E3MBV7_CAERE|nr:hypothetical protein CRE_15975 [Caenorhabditis remanei]
MSDVILESLDKHLKTFPVDKSSETISKIISWAGFCMSRVAHCVKLQSIHLPPLNTVTPTKAIIRLFTIEKNNFVMAHELLKTLKTLNGMDVGKFEEEVLKMPELSTLLFREIAQKVDKKVMKNLEFVKVNIKLNMFAQTPIPTHNGGFFILAADAIFDLLMDMIVAKKVFKIIEKKGWIHIKEFFKSMSEFYFDRSRGIYFIDLKDVEIIKNKWEEVYITHFKKSSKFVKKSKKTTGLKETLKFLELDNCFGDIMKYADCICSKSHKNLSPHALQKSILCCQVNSLVRKVPMVLEFIHNQGSCDRLAIIECELCSGGSIAEMPEEEQTIKEEKKTKKTKKLKKQSSIKETKSVESKNDVATVAEAPAPEESSGSLSEENESLKISDAENIDLTTAQLEINALKQDNLDREERIRMLEKLLEQMENVIKEQAGRQQQDQEQRFKALEKTLKEKNDVINLQEKKLAEILENLLDRKDVVIKEQGARFENLQIEKESNKNDEKTQDALSKLQAINTTLKNGQPVSKCTEIVNLLINRTRKEKIRSIAKREMKRFCDEANAYSNAVENRIAMIASPPELPEFPVFSQEFLKVYEQTMKSKTPIICPQLLKPEDPEECVICLETLEPEDETKKCEVCHSRNHKVCMEIG